MHERPLTVKLKSELGLPCSISSAPGNFIKFRQGADPVFLGLGPDPGVLMEMHPELDHFFYIECPELASQMAAGWDDLIPDNFTRLNPQQLTSGSMDNCGFILYMPGLKHFPEFWTDVLARIRLSSMIKHNNTDKQTSVFIFGDQHSLLVPEIFWETENLGFNPVLIDPVLAADELSRLMKQTRPALAVSVNLRGMDSLGENFALFQRLHIPVALWMVDNPFHLLTGIKGRYWTRAHIFVTDDWFLDPLKKLGASRVYHLPLAAGPGFFRSTGKKDSELSDKTVFIGRSSFPGSESFFAAAPRDAQLESEALDIMNQGLRPDFAWWSRKIQAPLWPGSKVREMGLGAEHLGLVWKKMCLESLERKHPLVVYGDKAWKKILPEWITVRPEIDYYGPLASIYSSARFILNLTNMHLPGGLTQRHFDVWAAKGFLITDKTKGLNIFPRELAEEISFSTLSEMLELFARMDMDSSLRADLKSRFHSLIKSRHTYRHRLENMFSLLNI